MKAITIVPNLLKGEVLVPPSKSMCHRAIIAAFLAKDDCIIRNVILSDDIIATIAGVQAFGAKVANRGSDLFITGSTRESKTPVVIRCKESGSTLRFLIPIGLLMDKAVTYMGEGALGTRPLTPYTELFKEQEISYNSPTLPICIQGKLKPGEFRVNGNISSQFISGLLFALPLLEGDSRIHVHGPLESKSYVALTIQVLHSFGIAIETTDYQDFFIKGRQIYTAQDYTVEGDFSQAAFWLAAGALGSNVACKGLNLDSKQGDKTFIDILSNAGASIGIDCGLVRSGTQSLKAFHADVSQCPDLAPILAVVAALSQGTSRITGAARLRIKECDRLSAITAELNKLGAEVYEDADQLTIIGKAQLSGGEVNSWGDHRIAMALTIAAARCKQPVTIINSGVVSKSYPDFFRDFNMLGGVFYERNLG